MRPLIIVCDAVHADEINRRIAEFGHPYAIRKCVTTFPVDLNDEIGAVQTRFSEALNTTTHIDGMSDRALVCCVREVDRAFRIQRIAIALNYEYVAVTASALREQQHNAGTPKLHRLLNQCGLSTRVAAVELLSHWAHFPIDSRAIDTWLAQFSTFARIPWLGKLILNQVEFLNSVDLSDALGRLPIPDQATICVNSDPRNYGKSAAAIAALLSKRIGRDVLESPAVAIEDHGARQIVLFEDALWTGTEAIGVLESLLNKRPDRPKTVALRDVGIFQQVDLTLAYGVSTDYGEAAVKQFLDIHALSNVQIAAVSQLSIASSTLLQAIKDKKVTLGELKSKPPIKDLSPPIVAAINDATSGNKVKAIAFCQDVGQQLFDNYLESMHQKKGWSRWEDDRRTACALGMHGMGLLVAFAHSIPKAALPLLWGKGKVTWEGRSIEWLPLFPNA